MSADRPRTLSERISEAEAADLAARAAERAMEAFLRRVTAPGR
jgi:hypothetical protein